MHDMKLKDNDYMGIIKSGALAGDYEGRYFVYIPELMFNDPALNGIWLRNEHTSSKFTRYVNIDTGAVESQGSYHPLSPGMKVRVRFRTNEMESGYIYDIVSSVPLVDTIANRDSVYLVNKTKKGSWIYQDDSKEITCISNINGSASAVFGRDNIKLHIGSGGSTGELITNAGFELSKTGFRVSFGDKTLTLDDTGFLVSVGETVFNVTDSIIQLMSRGKVDIVAEQDAKVQSKNLYLSGTDELHLYSNVLRGTGTTQTSLVGNVLVLDSITSTYIKGGQVTVDGLIKTKITGPVLELSSLTNIYMAAPLTTVSAQMLTLNGENLVLNGATTFWDGMVNHGLGVAATISESMDALNITLNKGVDVANAAVTLALGNNDMITGVVNNVLTSTSPSCAQTPYYSPDPVIVRTDIGSGVPELINYLNSTDESYKTLVQHPFESMHHTHSL